MKKTNFFLILLLCLSLIFNYFTWREIAQLRNNQNQLAKNYDINSLRSEMSSIRSYLQKFVNENKWLKGNNFKLDIDSTNSDKVSLYGEWTFSELNKGQSLYLLLRETGSTNWEKLKLDNNAGLTFYTTLSLSPEKTYQYQLLSEGQTSKTTDILTLPYEIYGLPKCSIELGFNENKKNTPSIEFNLYFHSAPPIPEFAPIKAELFVKKNNLIETVLPFDNNRGYKEWRVNWDTSNIQDIQNYELEAVVEYNNGMKKTLSVSAINEIVKISGDTKTKIVKPKN